MSNHSELVSLTSRKNLPDKAAIALLIKAKDLGFSGIGPICYEFVEDTGDGRVHQFSAEAL